MIEGLIETYHTLWPYILFLIILPMGGAVVGHLVGKYQTKKYDTTIKEDVNP